jgi:hypothetical protein
MIDVMPEQLVDLDEVGGGEPVTPSTDGLDAVDEQLIARLAGKAREDGRDHPKYPCRPYCKPPFTEITSLIECPEGPDELHTRAS